MSVKVSNLALQNFVQTNPSAGTFGALVAYTCANPKFALVEFESERFQPEVKDSKLWFTSMGSGQHIVDPFLGFIRRTFFGDTIPNLDEGIFATVWALRQAIELNPGGINEPMQIATIGRDPTGRFFVPRLLSEEELGEHNANVDAMTEYVGEYRKRLSDTNAKTAIPPDPPVQ